ncbi:MAG: nuclear transport factor 2 family protein, partial [Comamonadaceae bacterium]
MCWPYAARMRNGCSEEPISVACATLSRLRGHHTGLGRGPRGQACQGGQLQLPAWARILNAELAFSAPLTASGTTYARGRRRPASGWCADATESGFWMETHMPDASQTIIDLETRFWQAMVDDDSDTATSLLAEPAIMVTEHGAFQFTHAQYRQMAKDGPVAVTSYAFDEVKVLFPNVETAVITYRVTQGVAPRDDRAAPRQQVMHDSSTWVQ